mgnify:CR=1 FL=1
MGFLPDIENGKIKACSPKKAKREKKRRACAFKRRSTKLSKRKRIPIRYHAYITSIHWIARRNRYWREHERECAACSSTAYVQLHHMVYRKEEYGHERDSDLVALCRSDHEEYHERYGTQGNMVDTTHAFIDERRQELQMAELLARI